MASVLDARRLSTFRAVASAGSISGAARALHLSQPAVTAQIRQLEELSGQPLIQRSPQGVTLTRAGQMLLDYAVQVEELLGRALLAVSSGTEPQGPLVLGASTTIASYVLPQLVHAFRRTGQDVSVRVEVGNSEQVLGWVQDGRVPIGLIEGPLRTARIRLEPFIEDPVVLVVGADAPPELGRIRAPADLLDVPIVWREPGSGTRSTVERALKPLVGRRPPHRRDLEIGSTEGIKRAVALGLGVGFLSRWSIHLELALGRFRVLNVPGLTIARRFSWVLPAGDPSGQAARFYAFAKSVPPRLA
jgi:molybdate transport repressor ModE-like protein